MINGGHDNSLQILEKDHQWRKGIFQQDSQGTNSKEPRESQRSKNTFWLSRNASWTWIMIICGVISPVKGTGSFSLWLLNADLKNPLWTLNVHNCKGLDSVTTLIHPSLSQAGCSLQLSLRRWTGRRRNDGVSKNTTFLCFSLCCLPPWHSSNWKKNNSCC